MTPGDDVVVSLRRAARDLAAEGGLRDPDEILTRIVLSAVDTVPHADGAGVSVAADGTITSRSPSDETITELDRLQARLHEGPCVAALIEPPEDGMVLADDLAGEDGVRWPRFGPEAVAAGYRSILSIQLGAGGGAHAALNLYASAPHVFDAGNRRVAGLFGAQAAVLLHGSEQARRMQRALDDGDLVGQAKGILMERFSVDDDGAFRMLVRTSRDTDRSLVELAQWLRSEARHRHAENAALPVRDAHDDAHARAQRAAERGPWGHGPDH